MARLGLEMAPDCIPADRVLLRELNAAQAAEIAAGQALPYQKWAAEYPLDGTTVAAGMLVALAASGAYWPGFGMYQIVDRTNDQVLGDIGFHAAPDESGSVEIGYGLVSEHRGKGLVTEAVRALAAWAFRQDDVVELRAETELDHTASQGVLRRAGFEEVAIEEGMRCFVLRRPGS